MSLIKEEIDIEEESSSDIEIDVGTEDLSDRIEGDLLTLCEESSSDSDSNIEIDIGTVEVEDPNDVRNIKCFSCEKLPTGRERICWNKCQDAECFKFLCRLCFQKYNQLKKKPAA